MCFLFLSINFFHLCCCMMNFYFISVQAFYHTINYFLEDNKLAAIYVMLELNGINREIIFPRQSLGYSEYKNEKCLLSIVLSTIPHFHSYPTLNRRVFVFIFLTEGVFLFVLFVFALFVCVLFACVLSICVLFFSLQQCVPYACISLVHCVFMFLIYHLSFCFSEITFKVKLAPSKASDPEPPLPTI